MLSNDLTISMWRTWVPELEKYVWNGFHYMQNPGEDTFTLLLKKMEDDRLSNRPKFAIRSGYWVLVEIMHVKIEECRWA